MPAGHAPPPGLCGHREVLYQRVWLQSVWQPLPSLTAAAAPRLAASCESRVCTAGLWLATSGMEQPVCRLPGTAARRPSFTCADGLTYYNRCYMDAEPACAACATARRALQACPQLATQQPQAPEPPPATPKAGMPQCHPPSTAAPH